MKKELRTVDEYISSFSDDEHHRCGSHLLSYVYETTTELRLDMQLRHVSLLI